LFDAAGAKSLESGDAPRSNRASTSADSAPGRI
jgi:hypothetical protein